MGRGARARRSIRILPEARLLMALFCRLGHIDSFRVLSHQKEAFSLRQSRTGNTSPPGEGISLPDAGRLSGQHASRIPANLHPAGAECMFHSCPKLSDAQGRPCAPQPRIPVPGPYLPIFLANVSVMSALLAKICPRQSSSAASVPAFSAFFAAQHAGFRLFSSFPNHNPISGTFFA